MTKGCLSVRGVDVSQLADYLQRMAKRVLWANVRVPIEPRVRFYMHAPGGSCQFCDVTEKAAKLVIEELEDGTGYCGLLRMDAEGHMACGI
jgi:hypothetical protein